MVAPTGVIAVGAFMGYLMSKKHKDSEAYLEDKEEAETEEVMIFSYMQAVTSYEEHEIIREGFINTEVSPITNEAEAIERADNELGKQYSHTQVAYDPVEKIWQVNFQLSGPDGGSVAVYLNNDGITQMIAYPGYYFGE